MAQWALFIGLDTSPTMAHATVIGPHGHLVYDKPLPRREHRLHQWWSRLCEHGTAAVVVESPECADGFEVAVLASLGCDILVIPGFDARSIPAVSNASEPNSMSRLLARSAHAMPHSLRKIELKAHDAAAVDIWASWVDGLERDLRLATARLETTVGKLHPALAQACSGRWQHRAILDILATCGGPAGIDRYTRDELATIARPHAPRAADAIALDVSVALAQQVTQVPGVHAADRVVQAQARSVVSLLAERESAREAWHESCDAAALSELLHAVTHSETPAPRRERVNAWPVVRDSTPRPRRRPDVRGRR